MTRSYCNRWLVLAMAVAGFAFLAAACTNGGGEAQPTATATPLATNTAEVTVPVPPRPDDFNDYPEAIAVYRSEAGEAALGPPCLAELLEAWQIAS